MSARPSDRRNDIQIEYINNTNDANIKVLVFTKNYSNNTHRTYYSAWRVISTQSSSEFVFPERIEVCAWYYGNDGQKIKCGPFAASPGSTWTIKQEERHSTAVMLEDTSASRNPNNTITIKNLHPTYGTSWGGRKFDVGVYKDGQILVVQEDLRVASQVDFMLQPKLFFGVVSNMRRVAMGETFTSLEMISNLTEFDLSMYPNGMKVVLNERPESGEYYFEGESLYKKRRTHADDHLN